MAEESDGKSPSIVVQTPHGHSATITNPPEEVIESIYDAIKGKSDSLIRSYEGNFLIQLEDLEQLVVKFNQFFENFNTKGKSEKINIEHKSNEALKFSSLSNFVEYDKSTPHAVSQIEINLSFLIQNPNTNLYQEYTVDILFLSNFGSDGNDMPNELIRILGPKSINLRIKHENYVLAKHIESIIDNWVASLTPLKVRHTFDIVERRGFLIGHLSTRLTLVLVCAVSVLLIGDFQQSFGPGVGYIPYWFIASVLIGLVSTSVTTIGVHYLRRSVKSKKNLSLIKINKGDDAVCSEFEKSQEKSFWDAIRSISAIGIGILVNLISYFITKSLLK